MSGMYLVSMAIALILLKGFGKDLVTSLWLLMFDITLVAAFALMYLV